MRKKSIINKELITMLFLGILLLSSFSTVSASVVWEETFSVESILELTDWEFFACEGWTIYGEPFDDNYTIVDGALVVPYFADWANTSMAFRNSTVAYGTWSFDLFFPYPDLKYRFIMMFVVCSSDGNYFPSVGMTEETYLSKITGYGLFFKGSSDPRIGLISYLAGYESDVSDEYRHSPRFEGYHHFDITRNGSTGQMYVYHNYDPITNNKSIISYQNNFTSTSEKFGITSFYGSVWLDNITVSNTVDIPEPDEKEPVEQESE